MNNESTGSFRKRSNCFGVLGSDLEERTGSKGLKEIQIGMCEQPLKREKSVCSLAPSPPWVLQPKLDNGYLPDLKLSCKINSNLEGR